MRQRHLIFFTKGILEFDLPVFGPKKILEKEIISQTNDAHECFRVADIDKINTKLSLYLKSITDLQIPRM